MLAWVRRLELACGVLCLVFGFVRDGWPAAITMAALLGIGSALGAWWALRRWRAEDAGG